MQLDKTWDNRAGPKNTFAPRTSAQHTFAPFAPAPSNFKGVFSAKNNRPRKSQLFLKKNSFFFIFQSKYRLKLHFIDLTTLFCFRIDIYAGKWSQNLRKIIKI